MLVPKHRESDWIFSTESDHLQLLLSSPGISRLILTGNQPISGHRSQAIYHPPARNDSSCDGELGVSLKLLFLALSPKSCFKYGTPEIPILSYEDNVICSVVLERCVGSLVGEMVVEDVEIESGGEASKREEFRRRLRFKRMPNLVQTEELGVGALPGFLKARMGFQVVGVEADKEVLRVATEYFGLEDGGEHINVCVGDVIEVIEKLAGRGNGQSLGSFGAYEIEDGCGMGDGNDIDTKFDVVLGDLDSSDAGDGIIAPPFKFVRNDVLLAARSVLCGNGILAINVILPDRSFYTTLIQEFREVFHELYEIDVGNGENFSLIALVSPVTSSTSDYEDCFLNKLRMVISGAYMNFYKEDLRWGAKRRWDNQPLGTQRVFITPLLDGLGEGIRT
ncbi:methyltransferase-like protein 13 [Prunus yedoensis var. nudiflora]|uniref:Methyltransferase-like protein 13 n=1 Tax=Prunus yedoensis var. nudiflora TaxID=2094558 RepID=A0A314Z8U1_PRUYE|nr:methyltransferase-like protein 13 [Prunus yedoensis var. nudiflora]